MSDCDICVNLKGMQRREIC